MAMLPATTDRLFLRFCRTGDAQALATVFDRTAPELLRVAFYLCGNRADAEDLVQRTFLAAIESRAAYDRKRRALPWLCGILANHARRLQRERGRRPAAAAPEPAPPRDPAAAAVDRELADRVAGLRDELGDPYAEVLRLHLEQGLNAKEIAARLGRPPGTVRTQLVRALELLRKRLPSGFVAGLGPIVPDASALAGVKASVIAAAEGSAAGATGAATLSAVTAATAATGGALMSKKVLLTVPAALLLCGLGVYSAWPDAATDEPAPAATPAARTADLPRSDSTARGSATGPPTATAPARELVAARAAEDEDPGFASLRVVVHWPDGAPAPGVGVSATGWSSAPPDRRLAVSDAGGACVLRHLAPGAWRVDITHGGGATVVELRADEQQTVALTTDETVTLRGRVVDDEARPVPSADVWLATDALGARQFVVAQSRPDGSFAIPVAQKLQIGARKADFAPSLAQAVDPNTPSPEDVVLALRGAGGRVQGTVRDARGAPIAWARVLVGLAGTIPAPIDSGYEPPRADPFGEELLTGSDGTFVADGVRPGRTTVQAWAPGFADTERRIEVRAGVVTRCDFTLAEGAVVHGQVRDPRGDPIENATVGRLGDDGRFVMHGTTTDADGRYRLADLSAGAATLVARSGHALGATATLELVAGGATEWNPVLGETRSLRGIVLGPDGAPLPGLEVGVTDETGVPTGSSSAWATTGADGRFWIRAIADGPATLCVCREIGGPPLVLVHDVRPGTDELMIRVTADDLPSAAMKGRVVDEAGNPLEAQVSASRPGEAVPFTADALADGSFAIGPVPAGRYVVRVTTRERGRLALDELALARDAVRELGDLVFERPGSAAVTLLDERGQPVRGYVVLYTAAGQWVASHQVEQGRGRFAALQPGRYLVSCGGAPLAATADLVVEPAAEARVDLQLRAVARAELAVRDPIDAEGLAVRVFARDAAGRFAGMFSSTPGAGDVRLRLPPGRYRLDCRASDGRGASAEVAIVSLDDHPQVVVALPAR